MKVGATRPGSRVFPARFGAKKSEKKMKTTFIVKNFHVTVEVGFLVHLDQNGPNNFFKKKTLNVLGIPISSKSYYL